MTVFRFSAISFALITLLICNVAIAAAHGHADSTAVADTGNTHRLYALDEVLVTAARLPRVASLSSSSATVLDRNEIRNSNATSLANLLAPVAGLFVKDYGATSGLKTIAQRGLGPEHTLILVNGMRVSNPQNSLVDLGLIASDEIDRIEVLHGGNSASFGADAVAGVVNVLTNQPLNSNALRFAAGFGSFGFREVQLSGGMRHNNVSLRAAYREEMGDDDFPFVLRNGPQRFEMTRQNSDFVSRSATLQSTVSLDTENRLTLFARAFDSERGVGGFVVGPASSSVARQFDKDNLAQIKLSGSVSPIMSYHAGLQFHHAYERYEDKDFFVGSSPLNNYYKNIEGRFEPGVELNLGDDTRVALGGEFARTFAEGNSLASEVRRTSYGVYGTVEQRLLKDGEVISGLFISPSLRFDRILTADATLSNWSPQLGFVVPFKELFDISPTLRASVGRNFRVPTFNELLYAGGGGVGNPNLQPEHSTNFDLGGSAVLMLMGKHSLQCTYFTIDMSNRIVWVSAGAATVTPKNIRSVRSNGIELSYRWSLPDDVFMLTANYTSSSTKKIAEDFPGDRNVHTQLIYVPQETANFSACFSQQFEEKSIKQIWASVSTAYVSFRYTNEDNSNFLPSHVLVSCNVRARFAVSQFEILTRFEVNNLFDKEYQTIISYPMPGRSFKVSLAVEY